MPSPPGPIRQLLLRWQSLRLPWRRKWLAGYDLSGNTFWEFHDTNNTLRTRRIVKYSRSTHYSDVNVPPQWHQWLRHTRPNPPSIEEQESDQIRQFQIKQLAAAADARWASKPSVLDRPDKNQPRPALGINNPIRGDKPVDTTMTKDPVKNATGSLPKTVVDKTSKVGDKGGLEQDTKRKSSPWKAQKGTSGDDWQPEAWTPSPARKRS